MHPDDEAVYEWLGLMSYAQCEKNSPKTKYYDVDENNN